MKLQEPISIDKHFSAQFFAELWGVSTDTVLRWFQDVPGVLKMSRPVANGKRQRVELRIPFCLAMKIYQERTR